MNTTLINHKIRSKISNKYKSIDIKKFIKFLANAKYFDNIEERKEIYKSCNMPLYPVLIMDILIDSETKLAKINTLQNGISKELQKAVVCENCIKKIRSIVDEIVAVTLEFGFRRKKTELDVKLIKACNYELEAISKNFGECISKANYKPDRVL